MYIIKRTTDESVAFRTYDGWNYLSDDVALELDDAMRFTKGEAIDSNLRAYEEWVWYGSYK